MKKLPIYVAIFLIFSHYAMGEMRPATKLAIGDTAHFALDKNEQNDLAVQFGKGEYYLVCDTKHVDPSQKNIFVSFQLLKTNGSILDSSFFSIIDLVGAQRFGKKFRIEKPFASRLRIRNNDFPVELWVTIVPAAKMKWTPFNFDQNPPKPLGIGPNEGKGGVLQPGESVYHTIKLPQGGWDLSLYMKRADGRNSNIGGSLDQFDQYGFPVSHLVSLIELNVEARQEKRVYLVHPQTVILRATNNESQPMEYTIGVEKAEK